MIIKNEYGFFSLENKPSPDELAKYYSDKYYQNASGNYEQNYSKEEVEYFKNKIAERFYLIQKTLPPKSEMNFLDVGCGEGWVLKYFFERGWQVTGLDYSNYGCSKFNPDCLPFLIVNDIYQSLDNLLAQGMSYDVVWLDNVLEHVLDPEKLIQNIKPIVKQNGLLVIEVPNDFSILQDFLIKNEYVDREYWIAIPDHISYFNRPGLENLLHAFGWSSIAILADYPIDWNLLNDKTNYVMDKSVGKACHMERVVFENLIHQQPIEKVIQLYKAMADIGLGRQIVGIFRKE
jgi:2-polyprenyl-3-methyl-5-hydroxy-6-metoxy-1,4-benzoquinol methylase